MKALGVSVLTGIIAFWFSEATFASEVTCTVEESSGAFGSFAPPLIGSTVTIDYSKELPSVLRFSDSAYIGIGAEVTRYTSSRFKVSYVIGMRRNNPESPEEEVDFRIILDKQNILTIHKSTFSNQGMRYLVEHLRASCK